jgi:hypothetical protein
MPWVSCHLKGGLGNQFFQIVATLAYALQHNLRVVFSDAKVVSVAWGPVPDRPAYFDSIFSALTSTTQPSLPGWPHAWCCLPWGQHHYMPLPPPLDATTSVCLDGYFQSYRYFEGRKEAIFRWLRLDAQIAEVRWRVWPAGMPARSVAVHFRQSDYMHLQHAHNVLPPAYYVDAIKHLLSTDFRDAAAVTIYYACEDQDAAHVQYAYVPLLAAMPNVTCERLLTGGSDYKQLLAMACCDANVIANSSFSWWSAYLNPKPNKIVYYPSVWFGPQLAHTVRPDDMFPESWRRVTISNSSFSHWSAYLDPKQNKVVYYPIVWFGPQLAPTLRPDDMFPESWRLHQPSPVSTRGVVVAAVEDDVPATLRVGS